MKYILPIIIVVALIGTGAWLGRQKSSQSTNTPSPTNQSATTANTSVTDTAATGTVTQAQLAAADGLSGHLCWVAVNGVVYQGNDPNVWVNGVHVQSEGLVRCGTDATAAMARAPHSSQVLSKMIRVGQLAI